MMRGKPEVGLLISPLHFVDLYALVSLSSASYASCYKRLHEIVQPYSLSKGSDRVNRKEKSPPEKQVSEGR